KALDEARQGLAALPAKQRRTIGIGLIQIDGDLETVAHQPIPIANDRDGFREALFYPGYGGERIGPLDEIQALVSQGHGDLPAVRGERAVLVTAAEGIKNTGHGVSDRLQ